MKHKLFSLLILLTALALVGPAVAQDLSTKGGISGTIVDTTGAVVPGATITITGPIGERVVITDASGNYDVNNLVKVDSNKPAVRDVLAIVTDDLRDIAVDHEDAVAHHVGHVKHAAIGRDLQKSRAGYAAGHGRLTEAGGQRGRHGLGRGETGQGAGAGQTAPQKCADGSSIHKDSPCL